MHMHSLHKVNSTHTVIFVEVGMTLHQAGTSLRRFGRVIGPLLQDQQRHEQ